MPVINSPLFLVLFAAIAVVTAILLMAFKRRHDRHRLKPFAAYATAEVDTVAGGFSQQLNRNRYYTASFFAHLLLASLVSGLCIGLFFLMMRSGNTFYMNSDNYSIMLITWLFIALMAGLTWHALFSILLEQRIYIAGRGKDKSAPDIFVQGDTLYASISLTDGAAHDLLLLNGKPFLRLPLADVATCRINRQKIIFTLSEKDKTFTLLRSALGTAEKPLVESIEKQLKTPIALSA